MATYYWQLKDAAISSPQINGAIDSEPRFAPVTPSTGTGSEATQPGPSQTIKAVPVRHPGRWIGAAIVALILLVRSRSRSPPTQLPVGRRRRLPLRRPILDGRRQDDRADRLSMVSASCSASCSR